MSPYRIAAVLICAGLSACAGRTPAPVAVVQETDRHADCGAIMVEANANRTKIAELGSEEGSKVAQNVAAGVAGLFVWPLLFAMDFQNAAGKEGAALQQRNAYLARMAETRCNAPVEAGRVTSKG
jgi:hypothetical protein